MKNLKSGYGTALSWLAGQARRCVEDGQGGADNPQNDLPIDAAAAQGVPTVLHLEELIAQGLDPARRRGAEKAEALLSLGASSSLGPPEDLSTVEELQARLCRLPLHPTTKVSVWPCTVAVCAVYRGGPLQTH